MRYVTKFAVLAAAAVAFTAPAGAAEPAKSPAPAETPAATAPAAKYSTEETEIGTLLDDPAAKEIVEKHIPGMTTNDQVDMARAMTLKAIQPYAPEITDEVLAAIDADFAKLQK